MLPSLTGIARHFADAGTPTYASETAALEALHQVAAHAALMDAARPGPGIGIGPVTPVEPPPGDGKLLDEAESLAYLERHGLRVVPHRPCNTAAEAAAAFAALGPNVALKGRAAGIAHKSEHGLVALGLHDAAAVATEFEAMRARLADLGFADGDVIVATMCAHRWEFFVGAHLDPVFGPVVLLGEGGRHVEALGDHACLMPPVTVEDAMRALHGLRASAILRGHRGEPAADLAALAGIVCTVSGLMVGARGEIASIDLNPVAVGPVGEGAVILDALIERGA